MRTSKTALITNVQRFSLDDGPGIRTTIFFKGCTLKCKWCHNPETINPYNELVYYKEKCLHCKTCVSCCPVHAITMDEKKIILQKEKCIKCFRCVQECPSSALEKTAYNYAVEDVWDIVKKDIQFYKKSGGGITFSGGEPALWADWILDMSNYMKSKGICLHLALDTAGNVPWKQYEKLLDVIDLYLFDIKIMNDDLHIEMTKSSNQLLHSNFEKLLSLKKRIWVRTPVIPGVNDCEPEISLRNRYLNEKSIERIELLPYHAYGVAKYEALGIPYELEINEKKQ